MTALLGKTTQMQQTIFAPGLNQLGEIIVRLLATIAEENEILDCRREVSLEPIIQRKGQLLLELMRAQKQINPELIKTNFHHDITKLRIQISNNQKKLAVHFAAAKDITDAMLDVLRHNESDGTYIGTPGIGRSYQ
jgi:hypothetical protein